MPSPSKHSPEKFSAQLAADRAGQDAISAEEMREFLAGIRELDPQQIMGAGGEGNLARSIGAATVATVILMVALTLGPYAWKQWTGGEGKDAQARPAEKEAAPPVAAAEAEPAKAAAEPAVAEKTTPEKGPANAEPNQRLSAKTLERLGVDEVKTADPNVNPLETRLDDLLDQAK